MKSYLISSFSIRLLYDEINKIINTSRNVIRINYDEIAIDDVINECAYCSLLDEEKYVIVNNFKLNSESARLLDYLKKPNHSTTLILIVDSIDKRNSIYKYIKENGQVIEIEELKIKDLNTKVNIYCKSKDIQIDYIALSKLAEYNLNNYDLILNEIDKLSIISQNIKEKDIENYSAKMIKEENFELCDAITNKEYNKINNYLNNFISMKSEVIPFVALLASQYRLMYSVKCMSGTNESIGKILNIHPYRVKLAMDKSKLYTKDEILGIIINLADLDYQLKSTGIDSYSLLKCFLINI